MLLFNLYPNFPTCLTVVLFGSESKHVHTLQIWTPGCFLLGKLLPYTELALIQKKYDLALDHLTYNRQCK